MIEIMSVLLPGIDYPNIIHTLLCYQFQVNIAMYYINQRQITVLHIVQRKMGETYSICVFCPYCMLRIVEDDNSYRGISLFSMPRNVFIEGMIKISDQKNNE